MNESALKQGVEKGHETMLKQNLNRSRVALGLITNCVVLLMLTSVVSAQQPYSQKHFLIRSDMAPGLAGESKRLANPELGFHSQPVRLIVPSEARIDVSAQGAFVPTYSSRVTVGMTVGPVYRFKITSIPRHFGKELFPSIEMLEKLNPPEGLETQFPVQIVLTEDDLEQALEGRMVTKVVYLENPETALHHRHKEDHQPFFDVGRGEDPLRAAERLGRPMAIVRIGSRIPTNTPDDSGFDFYSPTPVMMADPRPVDTRHNWDAIDSLENVQPMRIPTDKFQATPSPNQPPFIPQTIVPGSSPPVPPQMVPGEIQSLPQQQPPAPHFPPIVPGEIHRMGPGGTR